MKVSNMNSSIQNKVNYLYLANHKFNKNSIVNNRYQNSKNKPITTSNNSNISNNNLLYDSYKKRGYNGILDPSLSGNNNLLIINNSEINPYQNVKIINSKSISKKVNPKSEIIKKGENKKFSENKKYFEPNQLLQTVSTTYLSKKIDSNSNNNFLKWNNIGFKEVKYKNRIEPAFDLFNKNNLFKSYQILPSKNKDECFPRKAENLGFFNDNLTSSYNPYLNNHKFNHSSNYFNKKTAPLEINRQNKNMNIPKNNGKNELIFSNKRFRNNYETPDHIKSIEMNKDNKTGEIMNKDILLKKNKTNVNDQNYQLSASYNKNLCYNNNNIPKKYNNDYDDNKNSNLKNSHLSKSLLETKKENKEKAKTPNNYKKNTVSLYQYYKDIIKKPKTGKEIGSNYYYSEYSRDNTNIKNNSYIKNVCKIQSMWRGGYVRELMSYYWSFNKFKEVLNLIITKHAKKYFLNNLKLLKSKKNNINKNSFYNQNIENNINNDNNNNDFEINVEVKNETKSDINKLKCNLKKKEKDYDNLLKDYNYISEQFNEIKKQSQNFINQSKNKIKDSKKITKSDNFNIINNSKNIKKFGNIQLEKKEELNIIQKSNVTQDKSNIKNKGNINEEVIAESKIDYNDYLNHFNSNLNIINNEKILIEQHPLKNEKNTNKNEYEESNYNFVLINNKLKEKKEIKEICQNEQICIINNYSKSQTLYDNDSIINKSNINDNELTTITSGKDPKESKYNFIPENQKNLNTEFKGIKDIKSKFYSEYIIQEQNNNINIINIKNREFNKDCLIIKNEILLNVLTEKISNKIDVKDKNNEKNSLESEKKEYNTQNKNISVYENERFYLINKITISKNKELIIDKKEEISIIKNKEIKNYYKLIINNNDNLAFKAKEIQKCDKSTEISKELNEIKSNNNSKLCNKINIENDIKDKNDNKILFKENKEFQFINNPSKNKKLNYNDVNDIVKADALEINPYEIQKTQNNIHNLFISYENKIQSINSKESIYVEKAKRNMMKIILPIRIKSILKEWIKKNVFKLLINNLKNISFIYHLLMINNNYNNKNKKYFLETFKDNAKIIKIKNYYLKEFGKTMMKNMLKKYIRYKWNINLKELAKLIISNDNSKNEK